ncbi:MAG TPA: hypothetical protein VM282_16735 [Acidimicrobiales bacterium]|nr:hypothetical protein [Acidimicrobiales bacterium]
MQHPHAIHNWGVFGADDEIGTLNYLTSDAVLRGIAAATRGQVHHLSLPLNLPTGRRHGRPELSKVAFRRNEELMGFVANDDYVVTESVSTRSTSPALLIATASTRSRRAASPAEDFCST